MNTYNEEEKLSYKQKVKNFLERLKVLIKNNPYLTLYVVLSVVNGIILRALTIKNIFAISPILADLCISMLFASFYFVIGKKKRNIYLIFMSIVSSVICVANCVYYSFYNSFISITFISFALANHDTGDANVVGNLLEIKHFIFLYFPILMIILSKKIGRKKQGKDKDSFKLARKVVLINLIVFICTLKPVDFSRFYSQWNREYLVSRFGVYLYQANDLIKSIEPKMASLIGSDKAYKKFQEFFNNKSEISTSNNEYTNIFKDKNVIAIHAESMQDVVIDLSFNNKLVAPNLTKLSKEGLYFSNFYSQVSVGTSSDTEFTVATSLLPVYSGTVFVNYYDREFETMYKKLQDAGYYTFSMHANNGDFWNRNIMHKKLGYNDFYEKSSYNIDEQVGFGLSDKSFMLQSVEKIKEIAKNHEKFYGTLITLSNHTPFEDTDFYGKYDVSMTVNGVKYPYLEDTKLGNYFKSVRYADEQIGLLIQELDKANLLDDTIIVIYGDHDARIMKNQWDLMYNYDPLENDTKDSDDPTYIDIDYYWYELNRNVPFIIWSKDKTFQSEYSKEVKTAMGMIDVAPTLSNMLGIYNKYALGCDIFEVEDNTVVFSNGNYLTNYVYYNDNKGEYKMLKAITLPDDYIKKNKKYANDILNLSNDIVVYDLYKKDLSNKEYEVE